MRRVLFVLFLALAGCAGKNDEPLPVIHSSDPTWQLVPDRIDYGQLPL